MGSMADATTRSAESGSADSTSADTRSADSSSDAPTDTSPADAAVEHGDDEGNTPAAWIACGGVVLGSAIGGLAVVFASWVLAAVAIVVAVVGLLVGVGLSRASGGSRGGVHGEHGVEAHGVGSDSL